MSVVGSIVAVDGAFNFDGAFKEVKSFFGASVLALSVFAGSFFSADAFKIILSPDFAATFFNSSATKFSVFFSNSISFFSSTFSLSI